MATTQNTSTSGFGALFSGIPGLVGDVLKYDIQRREAATRKAEAEAAQKNSLAELAASTTDIIRQQNWAKYAKYTAMGVVGLIMGKTLFDFTSRQLKRG